MEKHEKELAAIIKRVKALLAKSENTDNEHEAVTFAAKAKELLVKHNITMAQLGIEAITEEVFDIALNNVWQKHLAAATATYFGCVVLTKQTRIGRRRVKASINFVGQTGAARTAFVMFEYFCKTIKNKTAKENLERRWPVKAQNDYTVGLALGLANKLFSLAQECETTKAAHGAATAYIDDNIDHVSATTKVNMRNTRATVAGIKDGLEIPVTMQVSGNDNQDGYLQR